MGRAPGPAAGTGTPHRRRLGRLESPCGADRCDELACAWTLKEMLRDLYATADRHAAEAALVADWHRSASVAAMLPRWVEGQTTDSALVTPSRFEIVF